MGNEQGLRLYSIGVNIQQNRFARYIIKRFCDKEVIGKENDDEFQATSPETIEDRKEKDLYSTFLDEILILEELFPDRPSSNVGTAYKQAVAEVKEQDERDRRKRAERLKKRVDRLQKYRQEQHIQGGK